MSVSPEPLIAAASIDEAEFDFVGRFVEAVESVSGRPAPLHTPEIAGDEWKLVKECLDTEWVSTAGAYVNEFEAELRRITGAAHAIATVNGSAALHIALIVAGVTAGDEVIVPAITFAGTGNAVVHAGAVPHFADIEPRSLGLDAAALDAHLLANAKPGEHGPVNAMTGRPIRAVVVVHVLGHVCEIEDILQVGRKWNLPVIEDAAATLGSTRCGQHAGTFGQIGILSFNGNKIATAAGGGAVLCNDDAVAARAKHLTTTAKLPHKWEFIHDEAGFNYRLPNLNAALACGQMRRLDDFLARKRRLAERYRAAFDGIDGATILNEPANARSNFWLNAAVLDKDRAPYRDEILSALHEIGIEARPLWRPLHLLSSFDGAPCAATPVAEDLYRRVIALPSSPRLAGR
jgi:perosamine synthetase